MNARAMNPEIAYSDMGGAPVLPANAPRSHNFKDARRVTSALTAKIEKRILNWLAARMPAWVGPDHLTALGLVAQLLVGVTYALARYNKYWLLASTFFLFLNWFGDSLDGTLARYRQKLRPRYGFYVDHVIDSLGAMFLCVGLAFSGYMHPYVALAMLTGFLLLSIETYLATYTLSEFHLSHGWFGPTEIRLLLCVGNIALLSRPRVHFSGRILELYDVGGTVAAAGMFGMLIVSAILHTVTLYREERL